MGNDRSKTKKAAAAATRAEFQRKKQRQTLIRRGVLGAVIAGVVGAMGYCVVQDRRLASSVTTTTYPAARHLPGPLTYSENPPMGGPHNVVWQSCGVYGVPIHNEHGVHSLEHGAIWITYRPDLPADAVARLQAIAADDYMLLSPYPGLPAPVVASAWNQQIQLTGADDDRLPAFIRRYKNNPGNTPEFGASCLGGTVAPATNPDSLRTGGAMAR